MGKVLIEGFDNKDIYTSERVLMACDAKKMVFVLTDEGRRYLQEDIETNESGAAFIDFIEDLRCNSSLEEVQPYEIGALTDQMLLAMDVERDDWGNLVSVGCVYNFARYVFDGLIETLLRDGKVEWDANPIESDVPDGYTDVQFERETSDGDYRLIPTRFYTAKLGFTYAILRRDGFKDEADNISYKKPVFQGAFTTRELAATFASDSCQKIKWEHMIAMRHIAEALQTTETQVK